MHSSISLGVMATANLLYRPAAAAPAGSKAAAYHVPTLSLRPQLSSCVHAMTIHICKRRWSLYYYVDEPSNPRPAGVMHGCMNIMHAWAGCQFEGGSMITYFCYHACIRASGSIGQGGVCLLHA